MASDAPEEFEYVALPAFFCFSLSLSSDHWIGVGRHGRVE